jgi:hypothetical protein
MPSTYEPIATTSLGSSQTSVTFTSISSSFTDLVGIVNAKSTTSYISMGVRFNGDTGTNYSETALAGTGAGAAVALNITNSDRTRANQLGPEYGNAIFDFQNYSNSTTFKSGVTRAGEGSGQTRITAFLWRSTSAINEITFITSTGSEFFAAGSTFTLYGIKAA